MAWVKLDDQAPRNLKMLRAGPAACWLWVCGIAHSQSQLTDGFISLDVLPMIGVKGMARAKRLAEALVTVGLFERADGGYQVHDYHMFNATADEAREKRADVSVKRSDAGRIGGLASGVSRKQTAKQNIEANRSPIPSHPIPSVENGRASTADVSAPERVTDAFRAHWKRTYGVESTLIINHLQFMDLERQLDTCGEQKILTAMVAFFATDDPYVRKARHPLALFLRDPTKYLATDAAVHSRPKGCTHIPACADAAAHTSRYLAEQKAS